MGKRVFSRSFRGIWISRKIWSDERLTPLDVIILSEIISLSRTEEGCFAGNKYLADFCDCSVAKVSQSISKLVEYGYVFVKSFDGRHRKLAVSEEIASDYNETQPIENAEGSSEDCRRQTSKKLKADFEKVDAISIDYSVNDSEDSSSTRAREDDNYSSFGLSVEEAQETQAGMNRVFEKMDLMGLKTDSMRKKIEELCTYNPIDLVILALDKAENAFPNNPSYNYVKRCLDNWREKGLTTVEEVDGEKKKTDIETGKAVSLKEKIARFGFHTQYDLDRAASFINDYGEEWLDKALDEMGKFAENRSWGYVEAVLKKWQEKGFTGKKEGNKPAYNFW